MKNISVALAVLLGSTLAAAQVQAAVITYDFTATVNDVYRYFNPWTPAVSIAFSEGPAGGPTVAVGQQIAGRFNFDNAEPSDDIYQFSSGTAYHDWSNGAVSYTFLSSNTTFASSGALASWNYLSSAIDNFIIRGENPTSTLWFEDVSKTLFANGMPKGTLSLESLSKAQLGASWFRLDGTQVGFNARLDTLTLAEVPEPGTWGLILAGLAAFGAAASRKRS